MIRIFEVEVLFRDLIGGELVSKQRLVAGRGILMEGLVGIYD